MKQDVNSKSQILFVILGPTGSGKTKLITALDPACFEIISCDSRQVYKEMEVGTAAPGKKEQNIIPHHVIAILRPDQSINAGLYVRHANAAIDLVIRKNKIPVIVGGTGFYYKALTTGIMDLKISNKVRQEVRLMSLPDKIEKLQELDPESVLKGDVKESCTFKIHPHDEYRIGRALEVLLSTRLPLRHHWKKSNEKNNPRQFRYQGWILEPEKDQHWQQLKKRAAEMVENGFIEEARRIRDRYGGNCPGLKTLGYNLALDVLDDRMTVRELSEKLYICHRQYARRQRIWFKQEKGLIKVGGENLLSELQRLNNHCF